MYCRQQLIYISRQCTRAIVGVIVWYLNLQQSVHPVSTTTNVVSSGPVNGDVYSIHHYVIKFVSDLRQVGGFLQVLQLPPPIKPPWYIAELLLKVNKTYTGRRKTTMQHEYKQRRNSGDNQIYTIHFLFPVDAIYDLFYIPIHCIL